MNDEPSLSGICGRVTDTWGVRRTARGVAGVDAAVIRVIARLRAASDRAPDRASAVLACRPVRAALGEECSAPADTDGPDSGAAEAVPDPQNTATPTPAATVAPPIKPTRRTAPTSSDGSRLDHLTRRAAGGDRIPL